MKQKFLSLSISTGSYEKFLTDIISMSINYQSEYVCVANVHMIVEAHMDQQFQEVVENAIICTPDGMPLVFGLKALYGLKQERVAGMDLLPDLLGKAAKEKISVYFYGGTQEMLSKTQEHLVKNFPDLIIAGSYSPPFRVLSNLELEEIAYMINECKPGLVFVALGCPKQERWMSSMKGKVKAPMIGIGGALPVFIGMQSRAPKWMQKASLEWLYRLLQEPKRLAKRYFVTNSVFIGLLTKALFLKLVRAYK